MTEARNAAIATIKALDEVILGERHWLPNVTQNPEQILASIERVEAALIKAKQLLLLPTQVQSTAANRRQNEPYGFKAKGKIR